MKNYIFDVVGLGLNSVDVLCELNTFPAFNSKSEASNIAYQGGGQVATAMVALSRLGLNVSYIGSIGDDKFGEFSIESLRSEGVNVENVTIQSGLSSQFAIVLVQSQGKEESRGGRTIIWKRDTFISPENVDPKLIASSKYLHIDGHNIDAEILACEIAKSEGTLISFDAERVFPKIEKLIEKTDFLISSENFPEQFTGEKNPHESLKRIFAFGPKLVGMTLGYKGVLAFDGSTFYEIESFPVTVVDTTGAGDAFHAGFLYGQIKNFSIEESLQYGNAVAAINCTKLGGRSALPSSDEVSHFLSVNKEG